MNRSRLSFALFAVTAASFSPVAASAAQLEANGWRVEWGTNLGITNLNPSNSAALELQKSATFDNLNPLTITFTRLVAGAGTNDIRIEEERVSNFSNFNWGAFTFTLIGGATFDVTQTQTFEGGFTVTPFTTLTPSVGNTVFTADDGVVANNSIWAPGTPNGALFISVPANVNSFTFVEGISEAIIVPEPAAAALGLIPAALLVRRRR